MSLQTRRVGEWTVTEAGPLEAARLMRLAAQYQQMVTDAQAKNPPLETDLERLEALAIWPQIAACVAPPITADDWLQIPLTVIADLRQQAEILNPAWFVVNTAETEKKTRSRHKPSTSA